MVDRKVMSAPTLYPTSRKRFTDPSKAAQNPFSTYGGAAMEDRMRALQFAAVFPGDGRGLAVVDLPVDATSGDLDTRLGVRLIAPVLDSMLRLF